MAEKMPRVLPLLALAASACHTPAQADGNYYGGTPDLGNNAAARWAMRRMRVGSDSARAPAAPATQIVTSAPPLAPADAAAPAPGADGGGLDAPR
jgi:hypothetical protein